MLPLRRNANRAHEQALSGVFRVPRMDEQTTVGVIGAPSSIAPLSRWLLLDSSLREGAVGQAQSWMLV